MANFVDSLRMNSIYPGQIGQANPFGSPVSQEPNLDFLSRMVDRFHGMQVDDRNAEWQRQDNLMAQQRANRIADISQQMKMQAQEQQQQPQNVVYQPSMSDYQKGLLGIRGQELSEKKREADQSAGIKQQETDIHKQRADTYDSIMSNKDLSDSEKLQKMNEFRAKQQTDKIQGQKDIQTQKGQQQQDAITARGSETRKTQKSRSEERLDEIGARGGEARKTKETVPGKAPVADKEMTPGQQNTDVNNKARELKNTDEQLGKYIDFDERGNVKITAPPGSPEALMINSHLYSRDVKLPSESGDNKGAPQAPQGWKYVPKDGGGWTAVEDK